MGNEKSKLKTILFSIGLEMLINSGDIDISKPWKFNNPISHTLNNSEIKKVVEERPIMKDYSFTLDFLGIDIPLFRIRKVVDKFHEKREYMGILDSEENIHTILDGTYRLNSAHDSNWYSK